MGFHVNQGLLMEVEIVLARVVEEIVLIVFLGKLGLFEWYRVFSMFRAWSSCYSL